MVRESQNTHIRETGTHIINQKDGLRNASHQQDIRTGRQALHPSRKRRITQRRKIERLPRRKVQRFVYQAFVNRAQRRRTFGDNHRVSLPTPNHQITQTPPRQHVVGHKRTVGRSQQHAEPTPQTTMLERIVQHHNLHIRTLFQETPNPLHTVLTHSHRNPRETFMQLHALVANPPHRGISIRQHKTMRLAPITTREHRHPKMRRKRPDKPLDHRRLTRPPHREVTNADRRHRHSIRPKQVTVVQEMAQTDGHPEQDSRRQTEYERPVIQ